MFALHPTFPKELFAAAQATMDDYHANLSESESDMKCTLLDALTVVIEALQAGEDIESITDTSVVEATLNNITNYVETAKNDIDYTMIVEKLIPNDEIDDEIVEKIVEYLTNNIANIISHKDCDITYTILTRYETKLDYILKQCRNDINAILVNNKISIHL